MKNSDETREIIISDRYCLVATFYHRGWKRRKRIQRFSPQHQKEIRQVGISAKNQQKQFEKE
jgi:hypothetical protein